MSHVDRIARRRAKARRLAGEGLSVRDVAARCGVSVSTAHADLKVGAPGSPVVNAAEGGNSRALVHGAESEQRLAPLRQEHALELSKTYPTLDDRRLAILADRLARLEIARLWLDDRGVVRDDQGEVFPVVDRLEKWASRAEAILTELEQERRAATKSGALAEVMREKGER